MSKQVGVRRDYGYWPFIIFMVFGAIASVMVVVVVAAHDMWAGGTFRHYPPSLYFLMAMFGAVAGIVGGSILGWAFHAEDNELDAAEEEISQTDNNKV